MKKAKAVWQSVDCEMLDCLLKNMKRGKIPV
jgi:hypothetical protein